ncbi:hypothetical protein [Kitasatospora cheerisanensis]|uniref:Uncharacterized protein n=1 Tax=Kitasatospora cheerisanensis KCTC 2395 TaxID=1348663 RepID=A0A066YWY9_9ACTN|nr:hypothetical protein [Kitasatospora cheerisanensis]KDN85717.1 hypothetical protein KCH_25450 [Kitasatospora cheerisanensis KCTC 2395]
MSDQTPGEQPAPETTDRPETVRPPAPRNLYGLFLASPPLQPSWSTAGPRARDTARLLGHLDLDETTQTWTYTKPEGDRP